MLDQTALIPVTRKYSCFDKGCPKKALKCMRECQGSLGNTQQISIKPRIRNAPTAQQRLEMAGNMDSELLLKFIGYFPDYLLALLCRLLCFFLDTLCQNICIQMLAQLRLIVHLLCLERRLACLPSQIRLC